MFPKNPIPRLLFSGPILLFLCLQFWTTDEFLQVNHRLIELINSMNLSWKAGDHPTKIPAIYAERVSVRASFPMLNIKDRPLPVHFDARKNWAYCKDIIKRIRNQGECGSCWAVATASVISDRTCIAAKNNSRKIHYSAEDLGTCCSECRGSDACGGGYDDEALVYWTKKGIVSGGEVGTWEGCKPYSKRMMQGRFLNCTKKCTNSKYYKKYRRDLHKGKFVYEVEPEEKKIQLEIFTNGPVVATIRAFEDFQIYRNGVYRHVIGWSQGLHVIRIIGWGEEDGEKYWLVANSYGASWGDKGMIKFLRGENHCQIEEEIMAAKLYDPTSPRDIIFRSYAHSAGQAPQRCGLGYFILFLAVLCH